MQMSYNNERKGLLRRFVCLLSKSMFLTSSYPQLDTKSCSSSGHDSEIAEEGLKTLSRHLWYLNPVTVMFALFSDKVEQDTKSRMAARLLSVRSQVQPNSKLNMNIPNHEG